MKEKLKNKFGQKIIVVIAAIIMLFNIIFPTNSYAADVGGVLLTPIVDLVCSIGDVVVVLMEQCVNGGETNSEAFSLSLNPFMESCKNVFVTLRPSYVTDGIVVDEIPEGATTKTENIDEMTGLLGNYHIPVYLYGPDQIFSNQADLLKINFFNPGSTSDSNTAYQLQDTIASWYKSLRNLTVVGLLCVLVYVGIRIIISTTAGDKAKYKQMLMDWLIALCLVFFLHYIMAFTVMITEEISNAISSGTTELYVTTQTWVDDVPTGTFKTNLIGYARFMTQSNTAQVEISYLIMYLALVIYTVIFTWIYLKRVLTIAFLTLIAPVVALTYPIDKMNDGKAQAFNAWLREYIYNVLIQPFHLIIYTTLVTSAMDLASTNIIYVIAALGFMLPAEKLLKKFFGFDKAGGGTLGSLASGAVLGSVVQKAAGAIASSSSKGSSKAVASSDVKLPEGDKQPRFDGDKVDLNNLNDLNGLDLEKGIETQEALGENIENNAKQIDDSTKNMEKEALEEKIADGQLTPDELTDEQKKQIGFYNDDENDNRTRTDNIDNSNNDDSENNVVESEIGRSPRTTFADANERFKRLDAKYGTKIRSAALATGKFAFKAGTGTLAAAVTMATGGGLAGGGTAFVLGSKAAGGIADSASGAYRGTVNAVKNMKNHHPIHAFKDTWNGNTRLEDEDARKARTKEFMKNDNNRDEIAKMLEKQNNYAPTQKEIETEMEGLREYANLGITDVKKAMKARKVAKEYGISDKQSAMIAAIGNEREITKEILNDEKKCQAQLKNLRHEYKEKGLDQKQADMVMEVLKAQNGVAHNLKKKKK